MDRMKHDDFTMSPDGPTAPRRRRTRCNYHFKIDEMLKAEHRANYLALAGSPHMRVDDAHAWLVAQGYHVSRSAVARHRRHLLLADAEHERALRAETRFARLMTGPDAPDFVAGAHVRLQQIVFNRLVNLQTPTDADYREGRVSKGGKRKIPADELLAFAKLVAQCLELEHRYMKQLEEKERADARSAAQVEPRQRTDEEIRQRIEDILSRRA
jgi:hypothetical protein